MNELDRKLWVVFICLFLQVKYFTEILGLEGGGKYDAVQSSAEPCFCVCGSASVLLRVFVLNKAVP